MEFIKSLEAWFIVGSQHLYGAEALKQVEKDAAEIVDYLNQQNPFVKIKLKPVATTPGEVFAVCKEANNQENCIGAIAWMHTFSPAKMWIAGLQAFSKPLVQFHTQFNRHIPWDKIDMDYMNLHQTAHGDREFGFLVSRLRLPRTIVVGHWQDESVLDKFNRWMRVAVAIYDHKQLKIARFGDNMREVAVTEGDKVEAQKVFGYSVNGYGVYELAEAIDAISDEDVRKLLAEYDRLYNVEESLKEKGSARESLEYSARIEIGLKTFLDNGGFKAFTDNFQNLNGIKQLPGLAVQRLMEQGYGFGGEGDWKTAALVRAVKVMGYGLPNGSSFMEDYTYDLDEKNQVVLGAHMLEVCPSIAKEKSKLAIRPLGIGGKADPVRLIFSGKAGKAVNATVVDMGERFRMVVADLDAIDAPNQMPNLPVGHAFWKLQPSFDVGTQAWILAGGAHHSAYSLDIDADMLRTFAEYFGIEFIHINEKTELPQLKNELRWNDLAYKFAK
ncbi:L-arabinose isomerase [Mannheimia sp. E30BD]|uniref:L-arabinose isomerase n=1 Tax=Mannheimia sp. E30BD TaxID=3278708 RepID=UPI00359EB998